MKRKGFALLIVLMLLCIGAACAEEDYSAYALQMGDAFPIFAPDAIMDNGDMLFHAWADREGTVDENHPWHLVWMRDGRVYRDLPYATDRCRYPWNTSKFMVSEDNECYVILPTLEISEQLLAEAPDYVQAVEVYHWTENGIALISSIPGTWQDYEIRVITGGFALWDRKTGVTTVYDCNGVKKHDYQLGTYDSGDFIGFAGDLNSIQLVVFRTSSYSGSHVSSRVYALQDGRILWQKDYRWMTSIHVPGDDFVYVSWRENDKSYSPVRIERMDPATGKTLIGRTLSANKLVLSFSLNVDPASGSLQLSGRGIARSRNEYNAFVMVLDREMREVSLDVRRFCYYQNDYFSVMNLPDGSFAVYSNGTYEDDVDREPDEPMPPSGEPIIVPFEVLPEADRNGITIK